MPASPGVFIINVFFPPHHKIYSDSRSELGREFKRVEFPPFEVSFTGRTVGGGGLRRRCDGAGVAPRHGGGRHVGTEPLSPSVPPLASSYHRFEH